MWQTRGKLLSGLRFVQVALYGVVLVGMVGAWTPSLKVKLGSEVTVIPAGVFPFMFVSRQGTIVVNGYIYPNARAGERAGFGKPLPGPGIPLTVRSSDQGETWQIVPPQKRGGLDPAKTPILSSICDHEYCSGFLGPATQGSIVQLRDGTILIYDYEPEPLEKGEFIGRMWRSADDWKTVVGPEETLVRIPGAAQWIIGDHNKKAVGMMFFGSVLEAENGRLLATMYGAFEDDDFPAGYTDDSTVKAPDMKKFRSVLVRSSDRGRTWTYVSTIASGDVGEEGFDEPSMVQIAQGKSKGRLICVMRTGRRSPLYQTFSDDRGLTWSEPRRLDLVGVAPSLIEMKNGILALSFGHKPDYVDVGNFLAFSLDQGETWTNATRVSSGLTGAYTTVREIEPNKLFIVYDERAYHRPTGKRPRAMKDPDSTSDLYGSVVRGIFGRTVFVSHQGP